jgi:nucleotide sugar dehydrogenase
LVRYPKIVGGITESCTDAGVKFYEQVIQFEKRMDLSKPNGAWAVESTEAAEFVKLAETTYRDVNIGLANQFAKFAIGQGLNIHAIIAACNSQPYSHIHRPGISVGGHCIPIYPQFYLWNDPEATIVSAARTVNESMPEYYVNKLAETLGALKGKSILVLGVAYRPKVKEVAFSGAYRVRDELQTRGATAYFMDPLYTKHELSALGFTPVDEQVKIDGVILHTDHEGIKDWKQLKIQLEGVPMIDGRNHPEFLEL